MHTHDKKLKRSAESTAAAPLAAPKRQKLQRREVRIFLASTFTDMQEERNAVRDYVVPTLKAMCARRGLAFVFIDLRWGIPDLDMYEGKLIHLCLQEAQNSTHFVGLFKRSYGWHAAIDESGDFIKNLLKAAEDPQFAWVRGWSDRSLTELEMRTGVLGGASQAGVGPDSARLEAMRARSLFYMAGPGLMQRLAHAQHAQEAAEGKQPKDVDLELAAERRLEALKGEIRAAELPVTEFEDCSQLVNAMRDALVAMLERDYPLEATQSWLEAERAQHESFAESRQRVYVRSAEDMAALSDYAAASGREILVLHGEAGCGKSALLANWAKEWANNSPDDLTIVHFIGGSQSSSLLASIARRIIEEVRSRWPDYTTLDLRGIDDDVELARRLSAYLAAGAGASRWPNRVVIILDGLDQLRGNDEDMHAVRGLAWLPPAAGQHLRILVSSLHGPTLDAALAKERPHLAREIAPLTEARRRDLITEVLRKQGRALSDAQLSRIAKTEACKNALFLTTLLEELSKRSVHKTLQLDIRNLLACGPSARDLLRSVLKRFVSSYNADLVQTVASAIVCSRHGMAEGELKALLLVGTAGSPTELQWSLFWHDFLSLVVSCDGLYRFFHRCTAEAVELECGLAGRPGADLKRAAVHERLGRFFANQPASQRRAEEGPWALARGGAACNERLASILCETDILVRLDRYEVVGLWHASGRSDEAAARYAAAFRMGREDADRAGLEMAGNLLSSMGRPGEGIPFLEELLARVKRSTNPESPEVASTMQNLANLLREQGELAAALPLYEEALELGKRVLGPEHPDVAMTMQNMALLHETQGNYEAARPLYEEALRLKKKALGPDHPDVAMTMQNMAVLLKEQGEYAGAQTLYEEALEVYKKALGPVHPHVATTMHNLAGLFQAQGNYAAAQPLYEEALELYKKALGPEHPDVARTMQNMGVLLQAQNKHAAARPLFEEALKLYRKAFGPEHPDVAGIMQNLAISLRNLGDYKAARRLHEEALELYKKALGPDHPDVATTMQNLAGLHYLQGDYAAAQPLYEEALRLNTMALGLEHPDVYDSMYSLGHFLIATSKGERSRALQLLKEALAGLVKTLGAQHPTTSKARRALERALNPNEEDEEEEEVEEGEEEWEEVDAPECDACGKFPIEGPVWHCSVCEDFDLCDGCHAAGAKPKPHKASHAMTMSVFSSNAE